jgi:ubiquitin C-terminal hydrolase
MEGLTNLGSTCAINSLLQILYRNDKFKKLILASSTPENTITYELKDLFITLDTHKNNITPIRFINNFYLIFNKTFTKFEQIDICELFIYIVQKIHDETCVSINVPNQNFSNIYEEHNYKIAVHNNFKYSDIYKLVQGSHMHYIQCLNCDNITRTFEPFIIIPLDTKDNYSIANLMNNYYATELRTDDNWICNKCKQKSNYNKGTSIWKYPEILFVSLNRFKDLINKNTDLINVDMKLFLNKIYILHSIGFHHGSLQSGHYNAICRNINNGYIYYDDNNVGNINNLEPILKTPNSYIICYD